MLKVDSLSNEAHDTDVKKEIRVFHADVFACLFI